METSRDRPLTLSDADLLANDRADPGQTLSVTAVSQPDKGQVTRSASGTTTYTPPAGFTGRDEFTYTVRDGAGRTDEAKVKVTVTAQGAPTFTSTPVTEARVGEPYTYRITATDPDGDPLTFANVGLPAWLSIDPGPPNDGAVTLQGTPGPGDVGEVPVLIRVSDGRGDDSFAEQQFTITVSPAPAPPAPPTAQDDAVSTGAGQAVTINVLENDTGDGLTVTGVTDPPGGAASIAGGGQTVTYTPDPGFSGEDTFAYTVTDANGATAQATVRVTVAAAPNGPPTAQPDAYQTAAGTTLTVPAPGVLANDTDPNGDPITAVLATTVSNGTLVLQPNGSFGYAPAEGFSGTDSFTYRASDGTATSAPATVTITVSAAPNAAPVAQDDAQSVDAGGAVTVDVLANDSDPDGDPLTVTAVSTPSKGTAQVTAGGAAVRYTANAGTSGQDTFTYTVSDGTATATATVTITIRAVNRPPTAQNDAYTTPEDQARTVAAPGVLANDTDPDDDVLAAVLASDVSNGSLVLRANGSFTYTPDPGFNGTDQFTYRASDGAVSSAPATVTLTVTAVNDAPTAQPDVYATAEDEALAVAAPGVLANDTDPDGDALSAVLVSNVSNGTLDLRPDGSFTYTPTADFNGTDSFTYRASDGTASSAPATVTITVGGTNDPPQARDDAETTPEDVAVTVDVLANDTDPDGNALTVLSVTQPADGTAAVVEGGAAVRYTPDADANGEDTFTYTVSDGNGATATATVTVTVTPVNDPPRFTSTPDTTAREGEPYSYVITATDVEEDGLQFSSDPLPAWLTLSSRTGPDGPEAVLEGTPTGDDAGPVEVVLRVTDGTADTTQVFTIVVESVDDPPQARDDAETTAEDTAVTVDVLANDSDPDGDPLAVTGVSDPANGTAALLEGAVRYTPAPDFNGEDTFTYTISDGSSTATATVTVTVTPVDDPPLARPDVYVTDEDVALTAPPPGVLGNDADPDNDLAAELASDPANGALDFRADGSFTYTPDLDFVGRDAFTYRAVGGGVASEPTTVTIRVGGQNDAPVARADAETTAEDTAVTIAVLANDADPDGDALSVASVVQPSNGVVTISSDGTTVTYTPNPDFNGSDAFSYAAADGSGETASAGVSVAVTPVNDAPVAVDDATSTRAGQPTTIAVLANDRDVDGDALTVASVSSPPNGQAVVQGGAVLYTPDPGFVGTDAFGYTVSDGAGGADGATVTVTVLPAGQGPAVTAEGGAATVGQPVTVTVSAGGFEPSSAELFYRPAGGGTYRVTPLARVGTSASYRGTVPADAVTIAGVDYYVVLSGNGVRATSPAVAPAQDPQHLRVAIPQRQADGPFLAGEYRMVSLPLVPDDPAPLDVLGDDFGPYDRSVWRLFRWDPAREVYDEFPDVPALVPGRAVWLISRGGGAFDVEDALSADASGPVALTLQPGWNQIGTPFGFPVAWADVEGSDLVSPPERWTGTEFEPDQAVLEPWVGYFVENATGAPVTLTAPPVAAGPAARRAPVAGAGYRLRLSVSGDAPGLVDTENVVGFDAAAAAGRDRLDRAEPPPPGPHVRLSFLAGGDRLARSVQPDAGAGAAWDAEVTATDDLLSAPLALRVALDDERPLPAGYGRYVLDLDRGAALATDGGAFRVTLSASDPVRRLRVIVGTEAFAASVAGGVAIEPAVFGLERAAPNPVRTAATVAFSVPERGPVSLEALDLLGRRVAVLVDGEQEAGRHAVSWDPGGLASGAYVLRLRAAGQTASQTVTVVR